MLFASPLLYPHTFTKTMPSYAFVVNNEGEALAHPLLQPSATYTSHPLLFDIADLEGLHGSAEFLDVRRDIVSGSTGQAIINKLITQPRGYQHYEGYISLNVTAEYYYRRIIPDTSMLFFRLSLMPTQVL